jgi:hypothetical protein
LNAKTKRIFELEVEIDQLRNTRAQDSPEEAPTTSRKRRLVVQPTHENSAAKADETLDRNGAKNDGKHDDSAIAQWLKMFCKNLRTGYSVLLQLKAAILNKKIKTFNYVRFICCKNRMKF